MSAWLRRLFCLLGRCTRCRFQENAHYLWGHCIDCGKRHGELSRAELRLRIARDEGRIR